VNSPVHLSDDVMISLRAGEMFNTVGTPSLNAGDLAQPSTSYLAPYLFSFFSKIFLPNFAVIVYALLGFLLSIMTLSLIMFNSRSRFVGILLFIMLVTTTTFRQYSALGWDHIFQSAFLLLAIHLIFNYKLDWLKTSLVSISLVLAVGFRADGIILALSLILATHIRIINKSRSFYLFFTFCFLFLCLLLINLFQFGRFTPTTFRLKIGANPSLENSIKYVTDNVLDWSSVSLLLFCFIVYLMYFRLFPLEVIPIVLGSAITALYSFWVSDVFSGGRMFWASSVLMSYLVCRFIPSPINFELSGAFKGTTGLRVTLLSQKMLLASLIALMVFSPFKTLLTETYNSLAQSKSIVRTEDTSATSSQYVITKLINQNFNPSDGAIGLYWLGVSFNLQNFEVADFLGKGDEIIATSILKWGPPGHNKWDTEATLKKWNPQVIIPPERNMYSINPDEARKWIFEKRPYAFVADLRLNETIDSNYAYCFMRKSPGLKLKTNWGFYVRNDIVLKTRNLIACNSEM